MNGEERQLITGLFDRMRNVGAVEKDRDAEALINQSVRQIPDAAYMLVQSVLVQEHALQQAGARIEDLEARVRELEDQASRQPAPQQTSGGFLGGLFGGSAPAARPAVASRGSVPPVGGGRSPGAPSGGAWGNAPGLGRQQPASAWGGQPQGFGPGQQAQPAGAGFMRSAMATAAGVAGGMLVAGAISNMMGGGSAQAAGSQPSADASGTSSQAEPQQAYNDADNDPGTYDTAAVDDGNDPGWGGDDGGMDA
jgi:hypothetical protein